MKTKLPFLVLLCTLLVFVSSCSLKSTAATPGSDIAATNIALEVSVAQLASQSTRDAIANSALKTSAAIPQNTQAPIIITATPEATQPPVETPIISSTPIPFDTPIPTVGSALLPDVAPVFFEDRVKAANVLVYDDPDADLRLVPRVSRAIAGMGFSGGSVINTSNNLGSFDSLLRSQTWDLVILAVESRDTVGLGDTGVLDSISSHIARGGALIVETWNLDEDQSALAGVVLHACGAHVEKDWHRSDDYKNADFVISAIQPNSPVFSSPYTVNMPLRPTVFWPGDSGDLIRLDDGTSSTILAGILSRDPNNYGVLTSCLDGRMVLQTFSSHDYPLYDSVQLWQNMMHYTLSNYFANLP